jgi:RNA polymerase sigma-B factor
VEYRRTSDRRVRDELVEEHVAVAYALARRYLRPSVSLDDLRQVALVGLLKAVERFDPSRGVSFVSFAVPTITGELKRHFRDCSWDVRPPRRVSEALTGIRAAHDELAQDRARRPSVDDVAQRTGLAPELVVDAVRARQVYVKTGVPEDVGERHLRYVDRGFDRVDDRALIKQLLQPLPEREQIVIALTVLDELTQQEIARRLGVSQMQVSRLLRRGLATLNTRRRAGRDSRPSRCAEAQCSLGGRQRASAPVRHLGESPPAPPPGATRFT